MQNTKICHLQYNLCRIFSACYCRYVIVLVLFFILLYLGTGIKNGDDTYYIKISLPSMIVMHVILHEITWFVILFPIINEMTQLTNEALDSAGDNILTYKDLESLALQWQTETQSEYLTLKRKSDQENGTVTRHGGATCTTSTAINVDRDVKTNIKTITKIENKTDGQTAVEIDAKTRHIHIRRISLEAINSSTMNMVDYDVENLYEDDISIRIPYNDAVDTDTIPNGGEDR